MVEDGSTRHMYTVCVSFAQVVDVLCNFGWQHGKSFGNECNTGIAKEKGKE